MLVAQIWTSVQPQYDDDHTDGELRLRAFCLETGSDREYQVEGVRSFEILRGLTDQECREHL